MKLKIVNKSKNPLPKLQTKGSAGLDLRSDRSDPVTVKAGEITIIRTGLYMEIPEGYEGQVRSRSGLSLKHGIIVLNSPGTIDSDYRGQVCVIIMNVSKKDYVINHGDRIAQLVFAKCERPVIEVVKDLSSTGRGEGGFGSTGKK